MDTMSYSQYLMFNQIRYIQCLTHNAIIANCASRAQSWVIQNERVFSDLRREQHVQSAQSGLPVASSQIEPLWSTEDTSCSADNTQGYCERLRKIQNGNMKINNDRIQLDHFRWLSTKASTSPTIRKSRSHGDLGQSTREPDATTSMMVDAIRTQRPRSFSTTALHGPSHDTPMTPSTTWKES